MAVQRDAVSGGIQFNSHATGARRYGVGGSIAATRGKVDKTGYIERDLRKRTAKLIRQRRKKA